VERTETVRGKVLKGQKWGGEGTGEEKGVKSQPFLHESKPENNRSSPSAKTNQRKLLSRGRRWIFFQILIVAFYEFSPQDE
jgi:hypothetical protein